jgi:hypothetical protein
MNLALRVALASFSLLFAISPTKSSGLEEVLIMPLSSIGAEDTLNHYLAPMTEYGQGHRGIDLPANLSDLVISPASGQISFRGKVGFRDLITISFGNGFKASMEPVCSDLEENTFVEQGEVIGNVCLPDLEYVWHCSETCLHFGTRSERGYFSPLALAGDLSPSRLVY